MVCVCVCEGVLFIFKELAEGWYTYDIFSSPLLGFFFLIKIVNVVYFVGRLGGPSNYAHSLNVS